MCRPFFAIWWLVPLAACGIGEARTRPAVAEAEAPLVIQVATPGRGTVHGWYRGSGHLQAEQAAAEVSRQPGEVVEIMAAEGQAVLRGVRLARLDADRPRLQVRRAAAELAKAEQALARSRELARRGLTAAVGLEDLQFEVDARRAAYAVRQLELEQTDIRATIDGIITRRLVKAGAHVSAGTALFELQDPRRLRLELAVPERQIARLAVGQPAKLILPALGEAEHPAVIALLGPALDPGSGTLAVTLAIANPDAQLIPGMFARVSVACEQRRGALLVPAAAVHREETTFSVFVVEGDRAVRRTVAIGYEQEGMVEIREGLAGDDRIILSAPSALRDGAAVAPAG